MDILQNTNRTSLTMGLEFEGVFTSRGNTQSINELQTVFDNDEELNFINVKTDGTHGVDFEIAFPILSIDSELSWYYVNKVLTLLVNNGCSVKKCCGVHVHIGLKPISANITNDAFTKLSIDKYRTNRSYVSQSSSSFDDVLDNAIIKDVVFRASGKELSRINFYDHYRSFESLYYQGENTKNIGIVKHGINGCWRNSCDDTNAGDVTQRFQQNTIEYDTQYETDIVSATKKLLFNDCLILENGKELQIDLGSLVPVLSGSPLPLYDIADQLELEITFNKNIYITGNGQTAIDKTLSVDPNTTGLLCDFIIYDGNVMESLRRNQWALPPAKEYNLYMRTLIPSGNRIAETLNLGGANRYVEGLIIMLTDQGLNDTQRINSILSFYRSRGAKLTNETTIQIKANGQELFPQVLSNPAQMATHLNNYNRFKPYINREEFSDGDGVALVSDILHEKHNLESDVSGVDSNKNFLYFEIDKAVNKEGLILTFNRNKTAVETSKLLMRAYVVVRKTINCVNKRMYQSYL